MNEIIQTVPGSRLSKKCAVLDGIFQNEAVEAFAVYSELQSEENRSRFLRAIFRVGAQDDFLKYLSYVIVSNENAFSRACAKGEPSPYLVEAYANDLKEIDRAVACLNEGGFCKGSFAHRLRTRDLDAAWRMQEYYAQNGYGVYLNYTAFRFANGELSPILTPSTVTLSDLKGFEREKEEVRDNFENFVRGLPYSDMLLYGDRGTGKSSTVHAMVNEFYMQKLRLVELNKEELLTLPRLKSILADVPMKFIVFIDDFSLSESDDRFSTLKASLQGTMEGCANNVMIVATSNRRHIVEENFDTRNNSVHAADSEQELLSLADRFGITVLFTSTNKHDYLYIVHELAKDEGVKLSGERLDLLAERWALLKGGRSPRRAKQFIGYVSASEQKGKTPEI